MPIGRALLQSSNAFVQSIPSMLRWAAGDPSEYLAARRFPEPLPGANHPYRFFRAAHGAVVAASLGDRSLAEAWRREMEASIGSPTDSRDGALAVAVLACCKVLDHDEEAARSLIAGHLARHPLTDARGEAHLRHNLAIAYVTNESVRQRWDDADARPIARSSQDDRSPPARRPNRPARPPRRARFAVDGRDDVAARLDRRARGARYRRRLFGRQRPPSRGRDVAASADPPRARMARRSRRCHLSRRGGGARRRPPGPRPKRRSSSTFSARCGCARVISRSRAPSCDAAGCAHCSPSSCSAALCVASGSATCFGPISLRRRRPGTFA